MEISVLKSGTYYSITDGTISGLSAYTGTGLPPHHLIVDRSPYQHGEDYRDFRLDPREMSFVLIVKAGSMAELETKIRQLQSLFQPRELITMRFVTDSGDIRYAYVNYIDGLSLEHSVNDGYYYKIPLSVRAHDPVFYGESEDINIDLGGGTGGFTVPMLVPHTVGTSVVRTTYTLSYSGTWRAYPRIVVSGPITDVVITNLSIDEKLDFTGVTINSGTSYIIDCRSGYKTVVNNLGVNKLTDLSSDSDIATFHIAPDPEVAGGNNTIQVTGNSITSLSYVQFVYDVLYAYL